MKNTFLMLLVTLCVACNNSNKTIEDSEQNIVTNFLKDVTSFENTEIKNPIAKFKEIAKNEAMMILSLDKSNVDNIITEAKQFKYCVITTGNHTIIKITDRNDCLQSGSWGVCMPKAEGYINKGRYTFTEDYANNLIGFSDDQERKAYFFN